MANKIKAAEDINNPGNIAKIPNIIPFIKNLEYNE